MKILVTGSTGFVGRAVLKRIEQNGTDNNVVLLSSIQHQNYPTYIYKKNGKEYQWNLAEDFDVLVHIGAWTPKSTKESQNIDNGFDNILFTKSLIQTLGHLKRIVFISTLDVYAPSEKAINENSIVAPISIYGYSKLYCEEMVKAWASQNNVECCILRLGHIYGVGEAAYKKLIPMLIQQAIVNDTINIYSAGNELRSFLDIDDCADVIWQATVGEMQGVFNVVSEHAVSVKEIAMLIKTLANSQSEIVIQNRPIETRDCVFDNAHMKDFFVVQEKDLERGLKEEIEYFKALPK